MSILVNRRLFLSFLSTLPFIKVKPFPEKMAYFDGPYEIPLKDIWINASWRVLPGKHLDELTKSIKEKGLMHPILLKQIGSQYETIGGVLRITACRTLRWETITAYITES